MKPITAEHIQAQLVEAIHAGNTDTIMALGAQLDTLDQAKAKPTLLASALWYAENGLHVFPLRPGEKVPLGGHGCKDATVERDQVIEWWTTSPDANIGIATGHAVDVIDIDGPDGAISWARMNSLPPILGKVSTPRPGGTHLYVTATGRGNKAGIFPAIDYRGAGGYVVAPPSVITGGKNPGSYTWYQPINLNDKAVA